jgi:hypothetical protein
VIRSTWVILTEIRSGTQVGPYMTAMDRKNEQAGQYKQAIGIIH